MTAATECRMKHKHVNWILGVLVTIVISIWGIFTPLFIYLNTANAQNATDIDKLDREEILIKERQATVLKTLIAIQETEKTNTEYLKQELKANNELLRIIDKKLDIHLSRDSKLATITDEEAR